MGFPHVALFRGSTQGVVKKMKQDKMQFDDFENIVEINSTHLLRAELRRVSMAGFDTELRDLRTGDEYLVYKVHKLETPGIVNFQGFRLDRSLGSFILCLCHYHRTVVPGMDHGEDFKEYLNNRSFMFPHMVSQVKRVLYDIYMGFIQSNRILRIEIYDEFTKTYPNLLDIPDFVFFSTVILHFGFDLLKAIEMHKFLATRWKYIAVQIVAGWVGENGEETGDGCVDESKPSKLNDVRALIRAFDGEDPPFFFTRVNELLRSNDKGGFIAFVCPIFHLWRGDVDRFIEFTCYVNGIPSTITRYGYGQYPVPLRLRNTFEIPSYIPNILPLMWKMYKDFMKYGHPTQMRTDPNATATDLETIQQMNLQQLRVIADQEIVFKNTPPIPRPHD